MVFRKNAGEGEGKATGGGGGGMGMKRKNILIVFASHSIGKRGSH